MASPSPSHAVRCAILPPVPVPYREPLFARLRERGRIDPLVIYQAGLQPGWDQRRDWFPGEHPYSSRELRSWQRARPGRSPVILPRGLGRALRAAGPDCVVSWEYGPTTLRALGWCRLHRRPLVIFSELTEHSERELSSGRLRLHRLIARRAAGFVVASSAARSRLEGMGLDPGRVEVSLQSADVERFRRANIDRAPGPPVRVLSVGRLVPDKNLPALVEAFAAAGFDPGEAELELWGTGPLEKDLERLAAGTGPSVRVGGYVAPDELPDLYARAGALALVSTYEPFGVTMREGAAAGLPLVCSRLAGAAGDVAVDGENALLVDPYSVEEIAAALRQIVRDHDLRARLAAGSRAVTDRHPPDADAEAFERAVLGAVKG
jgi:glycosyltransferase involved in cell wall biosynthesis